MWRTKIKIFILTLIFALPILNVGFLSSSVVSAASDTYTYCNGSNCNTGAGSTSNGGSILDCSGSSCGNYDLTSSSGNTATFAALDPAFNNYTISVNVCSPSTGTFTPSGGKSSRITIGGSYSGAAAAASNSPGPLWPTCNNTNQTARQNITVNVNLNNIPTNTSGVTQNVGPATINLEDTSGNVLQTIKTNSVSSTNSQNILQLTTSTANPSGFLNVAAGNYKVCTSDITPQPNCANVASNQFINPITVTLTGTPAGSLISTGSDTNGNTPSCQSTGGPLSWITCSVIDGISTLESKIEFLVKEFLQTPPINLNGANCKSGGGNQDYTACIYNVWSSFRVFGDVLLVIAILIVVFGETIGGGVIDAYTVKKILPRILITAILINLSIYIVAGLVDITNIVGNGIFNLITIPFKQTGTFHINITSGTGNIFGAGTLLGSIAAGGGIWALYAAGGLGDALGFLALFVGVPALLAVLGVLLTIFFRTVLIVVLIMVAPVAFALYCLPNTEQYFRKWWDLLFKTLLIYPIVMLVFAMCDVGAVVVSSFPLQGEQWLGDILSIIAVAAPLLIIPFAFKIAGGALGSIHAALTDFRKRGLEAVKGNINDQNSLRNRTRRRFGTARAAAGLSGAAIAARVKPGQLATSAGRRRIRATVDAHKQVGLETLRRQFEETAIYRATQGDSNVMTALALFPSAKAARQAATDEHDAKTNAINRRLANREITSAQAVTAQQEADREYNQKNAAIATADLSHYDPAARRAALLNQYQIGFEMAPGERGWNQAVAAADSISRGNEFQFRSIMDEFQAVAKGPAGRVDLAGNTNGARAYNGHKAWSNGSLYEIGQGKPAAVTGAAEYYKGLSDRIAANTLDDRDADYIKEAADRGVDARQVATEDLGVFYAEQRQLAQNAKGGVREAATAAQRTVGDAISSNTYIRSVLPSMQSEEQRNRPGQLASLPQVLADSRDVRARNPRIYESPTDLAARQGQPGP